LPVSSVEEAQPFVSGRCRWGLLVERVIDGSGQIQREAVAVRGVGNLVADVIPGPLLDVRAGRDRFRGAKLRGGLYRLGQPASPAMTSPCS
jgi:hypothetical protein